MPVAVSFDHVAKRFVLRHEHAYTVLESVIRLVSPSRGTREKYWALKNVSFQILSGETFGIIGPNGAGKSTILKLMARILEPTSGNTGIGLAMIGCVKGYDVEIVMSEAVSIERIMMIEAFGAKVTLTKAEQGTDGAIRKAHELIETYPDKYFMFYDDSVPYDNPDFCAEGCPNVYSVLYAQNEGWFLAGVYAGAITASGLEGTNPEAIIGAVGGQDIPVINDFIVGYEQGACLVSAEVSTIVQYAGGWFDPAKGKEITLAMYEQKADIVFQIAGGTGAGVFEAAEEQGHYAIGVDSDQATIIAETNPEQASRILTSMMKNVDNSLYRAVDLHLAGELPYGEAEVLGIAEGGVGLADNDIYYDNTPENILDLVDAAMAMVEDGEVTVVTVFEDRLPLGYELASVGQGCDAMPEVDFDAAEYLE